MSNNQLPADVQERIKADAEDYALPMVWANQNPKGEEQLFYEYISSTSYIAGATAEHDRAQVLVDALEEVAKLASIWPQHGLDPRWVINAIEKKLTSAIEQWKGKEVEK